MDKSERTAAISDAARAIRPTLELLAIPDVRRILRVSRHPERPITELIFCHRRCKATPLQELTTLVQAMSAAQQGVRSFSGDACHHGVYIGNNIWGKGFDYKSTYCPMCGYAMEGPQIDHVEIVESNDAAWNQRMIDQCEIAAHWDGEDNLGLTYELIDATEIREDR